MNSTSASKKSLHHGNLHIYNEQENRTAQLEEELADALLLHRLSTEMIQEDGIDGLYKKIVQAAVALMRSQFATLQMLYPDEGTVGKLRILASSGFTPEAEEYWKWIYSYTGSSCGEVLRTGIRQVIPDYRTCAFMQNQPTLAVFLDGGVIAAQSTPLYSRSGQLLGMISTHWDHPHTPPKRRLDLLDILARQAADLIERTSLLTDLESKVADRTRDLQRSNEDLQQFAHVASHDLKEPVRKIRTFGLRLKNECSDHMTAVSTRYTDKILESASRMSTMIEGILTYSSANVALQNVEPIDLNRILTDIVIDLEVMIADKHATIECGPLPNVEGVQVLLYQLFYNLLNNSLKFSKPAGTQRITMQATSLVKDGRAYAQILLTDTGIGFDPVYNEKVFETFTRLQAKSKYDGTGLGLSLARKIVERHQGTITADGRIDQGVTITIVLPWRSDSLSSACCGPPMLLH
ncbi:ATP-binding protein [Paraflavitalea pollutisoli]|uniref:GAF domain-containing sensor histidine kinase n=1 Tax=Paraflavitalea pollutisoli TaxID=3034143 RepID=UPI0023EB0DE5|nr:ATP-binding protein [Paraflavitalea sp. H1-2-19X]